MAGRAAKGHDSGHPLQVAPAGLTWQLYVEHFVHEAGGWTALADELIRRVGSSEAVDDLQSVEKGLRRLARRESRAGGQYGRWMLRAFGVPSGVADWARWLAQYHSRFADLPTSLRLAQLRLWDCPPVSESRVAAWIHLGLASVLHRRRELTACQERLRLAQAGAERAGPVAVLELELFRARLLTDDGARALACERLDVAERILATEQGAIEMNDYRCYVARTVQQRAYHLTKPEPGKPAQVAAALRLFEGIDDDGALPFVSFRKCAGLAYCTWQLGDPAAGAAWARRAMEHAGDGGFVRFRIMAMNLLARMVPTAEAAPINERAQWLARQLEDEDLLERAKLRAPA
jgi:hypothetical protein